MFEWHYFGELTTIKLFESFQHEMFYAGLVKNFKWFNNNEFGVYSKTRELKILSNISTGQSKIVIEPKENSREVIEGELRYILYRDIKSQQDIVDWMNRYETARNKPIKVCSSVGY